MDNTLYTVNNNITPTRKYRLNVSTVLLIVSDLMDGNLTNYSIADFFQNNNDYFVKLVYYPLNLDDLVVSPSTTDNSLTIGKNTTCPYSNRAITQTLPYKTIATFTISRIHNNFLDFAPYTKYTLYVPFFEKIEIPPEYAYKDSFNINLSIDLDNNHAMLYLEQDGKIIATRTSVIGIEIPIGKTNAEEIKRNNVLQIISLTGSLIGMGVGAYTGNPLITAGSVGLLTRNVTQALQNNVEHLVGYNGGNGNRDGLCVPKNITLFTETVQNVVQPNLAIKGGVCKKNLLLSSLTGYTEIGEIHFNPSNADIYDDEISELVELLKSGVIL